MVYRKSRNSRVPDPAMTAARERIFGRSGTIRDIDTGISLGRCNIGSSFSDILRHPIPLELLDLFRQERYLIWFDQRSLHQAQGSQSEESTLISGHLYIHICLKEGYSSKDILKGWVHAVELCHQRYAQGTRRLPAVEALRLASLTVRENLEDFVGQIYSAGWNRDDSVLMTGTPAAIITNIRLGTQVGEEEKKTR